MNKFEISRGDRIKSKYSNDNQIYTDITIRGMWQVKVRRGQQGRGQGTIMMDIDK